MRAAVVKDFSQPLERTEMPTPRPGAGEVLIRVEASGLCHTDIHAARGDWPVKPILPFIPGHEGVGIIEAVAADVTSRRVGQRVAVPWLESACGTCGYCLSGWESLCERQVNTGYGRDGGFAEYRVANAAFAQPVPDVVSARDAAH
jgi:alcohol dehydrogenase, propanol-preferring